MPQATIYFRRSLPEAVMNRLQEELQLIIAEALSFPGKDVLPEEVGLTFCLHQCLDRHRHDLTIMIDAHRSPDRLVNCKECVRKILQGLGWLKSQHVTATVWLRLMDGAFGTV